MVERTLNQPHNQATQPIRRRGHLKSEQPFWVWWHRAAALRCRTALLFTNGNRNEAARLLGIDRVSLWRFLDQDNKRIERNMIADKWELGDRDAWSGWKLEPSATKPRHQTSQLRTD